MSSKHQYNQSPSRYAYSLKPPLSYATQLPVAVCQVELVRTEHPRTVTLLFYYRQRDNGRTFAHVSDGDREVDIPLKAFSTAVREGGSS